MLIAVLSGTVQAARRNGDPHVGAKGLASR
jgi:hypothetical protein